MTPSSEPSSSPDSITAGPNSAESVAARVIRVLDDVLPQTDHTIPLHEPLFEGNEWEYVKECIDTGWVSSAGSYVDRFERDLAEYTGAKHAVVVVNGTSALHVCLRLAGVEQNDEVILPALTFVATANAVAYQGAVPHFADSEESSLGLAPGKLGDYLSDIAEVRDGTCYNKETGRRIQAVVPMHAYGHPVDIDALQEVCDRFQIAMVEDAAESLGSLYRGEHTGTFGLCSSLSFNGNKTITTGGGGAILTDDADIAQRAKHLTTTAKKDHRWEYYHDRTGYNYRMPNLNAALGCAQLERLPSFLERKRVLANRYAREFASVSGVTFVDEPEYAQSNFWLNTILLDAQYATERDAVLSETNDTGYMTRPTWQLMHRLPMYSSCPRMDLAVAESLEQRLINIPSTPNLVDAS